MKSKNSDLVYKIFFVVVGVILAGLLIAWLVSTVKDKKREADTGTQKINDVTSSMADFDLTIYDGASIKGDALRELIDTLIDKEVQISVTVKTLDGNETSYNYAVTAATENTKINLGAKVTVTPSPNKSANGYITPTGNFIGEVLRNDNNEIVCLKFTQQK